ncbi:MAG: tetratricopeptide repeat protein [Opitutaceae bacterium]|nr:tetratricopeptide repeat protein [Opitutaceae bacterium]
MISLGSDLQDGWQALAAYQAKRALGHFESAQADANPPAAREARFGRAVALLDKQPITPSQLEEARRGFAELAENGTDDFAQGARFFLGRIAQHHMVEPDVVEASRQFRRLITEHTDSVWAQTALSRLALLEIYAMNPEMLPAERIAAAEKLLMRARTPTAQCELHYVIANAVFFFRLPDADALPHLLAAERTGRLGWNGCREVLVQIAELSRLAGNAAQAAEYYQQFLQENPRDQRHYIVKERLAALNL